MSVFEYSVIPSPRSGKKARGVRGVEAKFANALSTLMNDMGTNGWEYVRADTLPCEERQGLTGKTVKYHSMLVFRRPVEEVAAETEAAVAALPAPEPEPELAPEPEAEPVEEKLVVTEEQRVEPRLTGDAPSAEPFGLPEHSERAEHQDRRDNVAAE